MTVQPRGRGGASGLARVPGRGVMRTDRPATPGPRLSPRLDARLPAAPRRARSSPRLPRSRQAPAGPLALHGAEALAEDRVRLLPVPVPGGARRAREGAAGQVRAPGRRGFPGRSPRRGAGCLCACPRRAGGRAPRPPRGADQAPGSRTGPPAL